MPIYVYKSLIDPSRNFEVHQKITAEPLKELWWDQENEEALEEDPKDEKFQHHPVQKIVAPGATFQLLGGGWGASNYCK